MSSFKPTLVCIVQTQMHIPLFRSEVGTMTPSENIGLLHARSLGKELEIASSINGQRRPQWRWMPKAPCCLIARCHTQVHFLINSLSLFWGTPQNQTYSGWHSSEFTLQTLKERSSRYCFAECSTCPWQSQWTIKDANMDKHLQLRFVKKILLIATPKVEMDDACVNAWEQKKVWPGKRNRSVTGPCKSIKKIQAASYHVSSKQSPSRIAPCLLNWSRSCRKPKKGAKPVPARL